MNENELKEILKLHTQWLKTNGSEGQKADLSDADLWGADLSEANLMNANLMGADLSYANLSDADLSEANLSYAHLMNANLRSANLRYANLRHANLTNANLRNADLRNANLIGADLDFSCWPLWCGSIGVKVDEKIARQLMYHTLIVMLDSGIEIPETKEKLIKFANDSHVVTRYNCKKLED